ncbi:MAG: glycosyltransferase family 9 protein [Deltaproteobacteria bacterium]|jgi:ADP-heptose:LPS heptosyltransferase|nr:glycosyltransferase family 9 protein [Deltaproteobacteria bacterium]
MDDDNALAKAKGKEPHPLADGERILITRLSAIGDTVHSLFLADALRKLRPGSYIGWVVEGPASPLIVGNPLLDFWKVLPKGFLRHPCLVLGLRKELRSKGFRVSFDPQSLSKSSIVAWLSGATTRVGFARGEGRELAPILNNVLVDPKPDHVIRQTLGLLEGVGEQAPEGCSLTLPEPSDGDKEAVSGFLKDKGMDKGGYHLFAPGGNQASKRWPLPRYAELGAGLWKETGRPSPIAAHGEGARLDALSAIQAARASHGAGLPLFLAPDLGLLGVISLIRGAALTVGSDSFATHVAAGLALPTLMLFSVSDPLRVGPPFRNGASVHAKLSIVRSARARARLGPENMLALEVPKVLGEALRLLAKDHPKSSAGKEVADEPGASSESGPADGSGGSGGSKSSLAAGKDSILA